MRKHENILKSAAALVLTTALLAGCGSVDPSPNSQAVQEGHEQQVNETAAGNDEKSQSENMPTGLYCVRNPGFDELVISDGSRVLYRGEGGLVWDLDWNNPRAYYTDAPDGEGHNYAVYDQKGELLYDCGRNMPSNITGDWLIYGHLTTNSKMEGEDVYSSQSEDPNWVDWWEDEVQAVNLKSGEVRFAGAGYNYITSLKDGRLLAVSYDGTSDAAILNADLETLRIFEGCVDATIVADEASGQCCLILYASEPLEGSDGESIYRPRIYDVVHDEMLNYADMNFINDGYGCFQHEQGVWENNIDLIDPQGNIVEENTSRMYYVYTPGVKLYYDISTERYCVERGSEEDSYGDWIENGKLGASIYIYSRELNQVIVYDPQGNETARYGDGENPISISQAGDCLSILHNKRLLLVDESGILWERELKGEFWGAWVSCLNNGTENVPKRYCFSMGYEAAGNYLNLYDLLDENGNLIAGNFKMLYATGTPGVYAAQKGFTYGLIDSSGNWLWHERIFAASAVDEENYYW